ncbi:DUF4232 domain-containing protein [Kitasatospora sp. McL0602]|uniref:DUF4232 domain-containing protein n=1 Tax=Kitasatospora sp. McL0602 TaxID=3439530 RepID=UPI003F8B546D
MTKHTITSRRILPVTLLTVATALVLTACGGASGTGTVAASPAASSVSTPTAQPTAPTGAPSGTAHPSPSHSSPRPVAASTKATGSSTSTGSTAGTDSDAYAYAHPCAGERVSVKAGYDAQLGTTKRLIQVTNTGSTACGLSFYPTVAIDRSSTVRGGSGEVQTVQPAVSNDLGDGEGYPLQAGRTAYAVVDLNPTHSTTGGSRQYDELSVVASTKLPNAYTVSTMIAEQGGTPGNPYVKTPFLGKYSDTVADAAATANPTGH